MAEASKLTITYSANETGGQVSEITALGCPQLKAIVNGLAELGLSVPNLRQGNMVRITVEEPAGPKARKRRSKR
jgi:phosphoribosylformylglycinamidine (FGAM) synthase PurS component